jgi:hypothetical protein
MYLNTPWAPGEVAEWLAKLSAEAQARKAARLAKN